MDWSRCPVIESDPEKVGGAWCFKGTRVTVQAILDNLQDRSLDEVAAGFHYIPKNWIVTLLNFIAQSSVPVVIE